MRFPVELEPSDGFDPGRLETWPRVDGRLEWVAGRLCWMLPCGARQSMTVADVVWVLGRWARTRWPGLASGLPVLAVEVGGRAESSASLRAKAASHLAHGVSVVWLVLPEGRRIVVVTRDGDTTVEPGETLPAHPALPDLAPAVDDLLRQVLPAG